MKLKLGSHDLCPWVPPLRTTESLSPRREVCGAWGLPAHRGQGAAGRLGSEAQLIPLLGCATLGKSVTFRTVDSLVVFQGNH